MATTVNRLNDGGVNYTVTINETTKTNQSLNTTNSFSGEFDEVFLSPGSIYFNGTSDYLTANTNGVGAKSFVGGEDFTIDFWVNPYSTGTNRPLFDSRTPDTANLGADIYLTTTNTLSVSTTGPFVYITGTSPVPLYTWSHVALVRSNTVMRLYLNGVAEGSAFTPADATQNFTNSSIRIGYGVQANYFKGYISNYRIVQKALYTSAFTPTPTQMLPVPIKSGLSNAVGSVYMPSGAGIFNCTATSTVWQNVFTVECWVYLDIATLPTGSSYYFVANGGAGGNASGPIIIDNGNFIKQGTGGTNFTNTGAVPKPRRWNHLAWVSQGIGVNQFSFFLNGVLQSTGQFAQTLNGGQTFGIGNVQNGSGSGTRPAYYSNFRIVQGAALYTSNFTPPSGPLTMPTGYYGLLLNFNQGSNYLVDANTTPATISATGTSSNTANPFDNENILLMPTPYGTGGAFYPDTGLRTSVTTVPPVSGVSTNYYPYRDANYSYGSIGFNGSSQYLSTPNGTKFDFGTGDFTVEFWMNALAVGTYTAVVGTQSIAGSGVNGMWRVSTRLNSVNGIYFNYVSSGTFTDLTFSTTNYNDGIWHHVAACRASGTLRMFVDGVSLGTPTSVTSTLTSAQVLNIGFQPQDGTYYGGSISNLRIIRGTALYTTNFTPSTGPLSVVANTVLLLNTTRDSPLVDSNTTPGTITNTGGVTGSGSFPFQPYYPGSIGLNGSSQYLTLPINSAYAFNTNNFTVECWIYLNAVPTASPEIFFSGDFHLNFRGSGQLGITNDATVYALSGVALTAGQWYHVAAVRTSGSSVIYVNGIAGTAVSCTYNFTQTRLTQIGTGNLGSGPFINGYISNLRVVSGTALYTSNFSIPTSPPTVVANTVLLLNTPANSSFLTDSNTTPSSVTNNGSITANTLSPFVSTTGSVYFEGVSSYLKAASTFVTPTTTTPFTIEAWVNPSSFGPVCAISFGDSGSNPFMGLGFTASAGASSPDTGGAYPYFGYYPGTWQMIISPTPAVVNTWIHMAAVFNGTSTTLYVNGANVAGGIISSYAITTGTNAFMLGRRWDTFSGVNYFNGYISNFRVVKGVAVYTGNFTPSSKPLTATQIASTNTNAITGTQTDILLNTPYYPQVISSNSFTFNTGNTGYSTTVFGTPVSSPISPVSVPPVNKQIPVRRISNLGTNPGIYGSVALNGTSQYLSIPKVVVNDSSNASVTITNVGSVTASTLSPFTNTYSLPASISLNGTSQYLTVPGSAALTFGTGDFTIELWVYPTSTTWTTGNFYFWDINSPSVTLQYYQNQLRYYNTTIGVGSSLYNSGKSLLLNTWVHIAIVRQSGTTRMFVDGILITSAADSYNAGQSATVYLCTSSGGAPFEGYISNLRIVKGVVYTGNFTRPTAPLSITQNPGTPSSNIAAITGTQTSLLLNTPNMAGLNFGTGDFTVEAWIRPFTVTTSYFILNGSSGSGFFFGIDGTNGLGWGRSTIAWDYAVTFTAATSYITINTWNHVAVCRNGTNMRLFVNGSQIGTTQTNSTAYDASAFTEARVGAETSSGYFPGFISNLRVVKGVGVYTGNFTVPTAPLSAVQPASTNISAVTIAQTSMLLNTANNSDFYLDSSINNLVVGNNTSANSSFLTPFNNYPKSLTQTYGFIDEVTTIV